MLPMRHQKFRERRELAEVTWLGPAGCGVPPRPVPVKKPVLVRHSVMPLHVTPPLSASVSFPAHGTTVSMLQACCETCCPLRPSHLSCLPLALGPRLGEARSPWCTLRICQEGAEGKEVLTLR